MEINKFSDIIGVVTTEDIPEGRFVLVTSHSQDYDFGSRTDLMGIKMPDTTTEAARAYYLAVFAQDNRSLPIFQPTPSYTFQLRSGWGVGANNVPITGSTVYLTHPGNMLGQTIPSGQPALAMGGGIYTLASGEWIYNVNLETPGVFVAAADTASDGASDAGKAKYSATKAVAQVERYYSNTGALTIRTLVP
jgi:hypothetical protein